MALLQPPPNVYLRYMALIHTVRQSYSAEIVAFHERGRRCLSAYAPDAGCVRRHNLIVDDMMAAQDRVIDTLNFELQACLVALSLGRGSEDEMLPGSEYSKDVARRFVDGEYSWAARARLMAAVV